MKSIVLHHRTYLVPENWNELTSRQLVAVLQVFDAPGELFRAKVWLLKILTGINTFRLMRCSAEQVSEYLYLVDFLIGNNTLTRNPMPRYRGLYGPMDNFDNLQMSEFTYSEDWYLRWKDDPSNIALLDQLVAVLYRKAKPQYNHTLNPEGDVREAFNEHGCRWTANKVICKWPLKIKRAIAHWYEGCRGKLVEDFHDIFNGTDSDPSRYGMVSIMLGLAEEGTFGPFKEVEKQYVRLVMVQLHEMKLLSDKLKRQANG